MQRTGLAEAELLIAMSHTHATANANSQLTDRPGVELIRPYLDLLARRIGDAILEARSTTTEAFVTYGHGRCGLAANRDLWDAEAGRFACGYNPGAPADDTLLVARVTSVRRDDPRHPLQLRLPPHQTIATARSISSSPIRRWVTRRILLVSRSRRAGPLRLGSHQPLGSIPVSVTSASTMFVSITSGS